MGIMVETREGVKQPSRKSCVRVKKLKKCAKLETFIRLPHRSPNLNAYVERFVLSIKSECLERMIFFSEQSLRRAVAEFIHHYHGERNHQGLGNALLEAEECVGSPHGKVRCRKRLGGLLSYYHRDAA